MHFVRWSKGVAVGKDAYIFLHPNISIRGISLSERQFQTWTLPKTIAFQEVKASFSVDACVIWNERIHYD